MGPEDLVVQRVVALAARQDGVVTRRALVAAGVPPHVLRRLLRGGEWSPLLRGSYLVDPGRAGPALQRSWARAAVLTVPGAVVGKGTAAVLHGLDGVPRSGVVDVVVDRHVKARQRRLRPHRFTLDPVDVVDLGGLPTTSVPRTLADLVPQLARPEALAVLDSALRTAAVDRGGLQVAAGLAARRPGCEGVRDLWALADGRSESPLESRVRLRCVEGGVPPDELQLEVRDEHGHLLARADLAFQERTRGRRLPLLLEADGRRFHDAPEALHRDRWRANALVALGYDVIRCTWADAMSRTAVPWMVRQAL